MRQGRNYIMLAMIEERNKNLVRISELTGVSGDDILGCSRLMEIVTARSLLAWVLTDLCGYTTMQAGILIRRHYTSVIYLRNKITTAMRLPMDLRLIIEDLRNYNKKISEDEQAGETKRNVR